MAKATRVRDARQRKTETADPNPAETPRGDVPQGAVQSRPAAAVRGAATATAAGRTTMLEETAVHRSKEAVPPPPRTDQPDVASLLGRRIGQYRVDSIVGRGTMACVFKAKHLGLGRSCALKVMEPSLVARQPGLREQFWAEARAAANLQHPNVVTIHNLGSAQGFHFIEMEYVKGGHTLRESLVRGGPLEPMRAATLTRQIVLALGRPTRPGSFIATSSRPMCCSRLTAARNSPISGS